MEVQVTVLSRRGSAIMRRTRTVSSHRVCFGRGTGNEIPLSDIRVDLTAAALFPVGGGIRIESLGPSPVRVNGTNATAAAVKPGDEILIGPYQIRLSEPPPGIDATLTIELVQPLSDSLRLTSSSRIGLERAISKRRIAWIGALLVMVIFFAAPILIYASKTVPAWRKAGSDFNPTTLIALLWKPGELSNSHRFFAANCKTCHATPFLRVTDDACLACHEKIGAHTASGANLGVMQQVLDARRCTDCHLEHRGTRGLIVSDMRLCLDCHRTLAEAASAADVSNVTGFPKGHPQFRATVVADAAKPSFQRVDVADKAAAIDRPGIKFSHAAHLVSGGFPALGIKQMGCADCHVAEPSGQGFQPITYKQQCARCHALDFDRQDLPWPNARVPHGDDAGVAAAVWNFYAGKVLQGGISEPPAPEVSQRVPGPPTRAIAETPGADPQAWVASKTEAVLQTVVFDEKRGCGYCHFGTGPQGAFEIAKAITSGAGQPRVPTARIVAPVILQSRFLPFAWFDHSKHVAVGCEECHAAAKAEAVGALLIPPIETCVGCHGGERAALRAQSTCTSCHGFHRDFLGPMRKAATAAP
jgi:predicted CXXCH cytochrome family protein